MKTIGKITTAIALAIVGVFLLAACSMGGSSHVDSQAKSAPKPSATVQTDPLLKGFGDTITYKDGVSVSVSQPAAWTPDPMALEVAQQSGMDAGMQTVLFNVVVTNNSKKSLDLTALPTATSQGKAAYSISDVANNVGMAPMNTLLPGQSITWKEGFGVADPSDITLELSPGFAYAKAIFDSKH